MAFIKIANPALRRALRTFLQAFLGVATVSAVSPFVIAAVTGDAIDFKALRLLFASALVAGVTALWSYVQNALEDKTGTDIIVQKH